MVIGSTTVMSNVRIKFHLRRVNGSAYYAKRQLPRGEYLVRYLTIIRGIKGVDDTSIAWNSKGNEVETTTEHDATRRLQQQLPQQRYLTYDICLNHDVVRLHKPVPEPEHGALYSSQASAR